MCFHDVHLFLTQLNQLNQSKMLDADHLEQLTIITFMIENNLHYIRHISQIKSN